MHPRHLSTLNHIYLAALYKSADVSKFGFDVVLEPLVNDLKELESTGLEMNCSGYQGNLKVALAQFIGDNLVIHSLFGFATGLAAKLPMQKM